MKIPFLSQKLFKTHLASTVRNGSINCIFSINLSSKILFTEISVVEKSSHNSMTKSRICR